MAPTDASGLGKLAACALVLSLVASAGASSASAAAAAFSLVFTDGHFNMSAAPLVKCGGDGTMPFWIRTAQFDAAGSRLTEPADFTTELCGAGYLSVAGSKLIFASMDLTTPGNIGNVASYVVDLSLPNGTRCECGHPSADQHLVMAQRALAVVKGAMGW